MIGYPRLMESKKHGAIVLFAEPCVGIVMSIFDKSKLTVGTQLQLTNMDDFSIYFGTVTLKNTLETNK